MDGLTQLISLKEGVEPEKPVLHDVLGENARGESKGNGRLILVGDRGFDDFLPFFDAYEGYKLSNSAGGRVYLTWGEYEKTRGAETKPHDSLNLIHLGWGTGGLSADFSIDSKGPAAEVWNAFQAAILLAAQPQNLVTAVAEKMVLVTKYFFMVHGNINSIAVPHEKKHVTFHNTRFPPHEITLGEIRNVVLRNVPQARRVKGLTFKAT